MLSPGCCFIKPFKYVFPLIFHLLKAITWLTWYEKKANPFVILLIHFLILCCNFHPIWNLISQLLQKVKGNIEEWRRMRASLRFTEKKKTGSNYGSGHRKDIRKINVIFLFNLSYLFWYWFFTSNVSNNSSSVIGSLFGSWFKYCLFALLYSCQSLFWFFNILQLFFSIWLP